MKSQNVRITRDLTRPEAEGVHFRLLCMTGKNKGLVYYLKGKRVVLGRSDKIDVQVLDTKSSREHAELTRFGNTYIATDLGSQNGIIINDLKVSQHQLTDGDKIIIGQTVFKFNIIVVKNELIEVDEEDEDEEDDDEEYEEEVTKKSKKKAASPADKKKKLIYAAVAVLLVVMFLPSEPPKKTTKKPVVAKEDKSLAEVLRNRNKDYDQETEEKIDVILHRGYRELRENNYMRAIEEFNMALILSPNHGRASASLEKSKMLLDEQVKSQFNKAKREIDSLKYQKAVRIYCSILRYLQEKPEDERYKRADKEIKAIIDEQGLRADEVKCF
ncbi:FHA domain-containing protein [Halobacteriovorax sp. HLS]|uniref:FHA domain-containing protein n=1 Tax=Halobacteriovorax sp. HLS TaxID=2234000 RepID=UPI000FD7F5AB|nr:FHA domain-containing protein [Halobacteriovorax sp. HLS]